MALDILIIGQTGSGKTYSFKNLNPQETYFIKCFKRRITFKGGEKNYIQKDGGNCFLTNNYNTIKTLLLKINNERPHIKQVILDDAGYLLTDAAMRDALIKNYEKFTIQAQEFYDLVKFAKNLREDLAVIFTMHSDFNEAGKLVLKTTGKMLDKVANISGTFDHIFHAIKIEDEYFFLTNEYNIYLARTPEGMFSQIKINNDIAFIITTAHNFYNEDIPI